MQTSHSRRTYDYRIQEAICETGDRDLFPDLEIPRSTIRSWIHRGVPDVVTGNLAARDRADLVTEIHQLHRRTALVPRQYPESGLGSAAECPRVAVVQPADPRNCDDLPHFSGFDRPLLRSVLF